MLRPRRLAEIDNLFQLANVFFALIQGADNFQALFILERFQKINRNIDIAFNVPHIHGKIRIIIFAFRNRFGRRIQ